MVPGKIRSIAYLVRRTQSSEITAICVVNSDFLYCEKSKPRVQRAGPSRCGTHSLARAEPHLLMNCAQGHFQ
eukprot:5303862-Pleurochrysis_carterae.AAC.1